MVNVEEMGERAGQLRFYIRAVGDGEMSRYLTRLRPGHTVWLRGPHVGFDLVPRLGASKSIVFLAGGTGVVPGMQAARVVLDGFEDSKVSLLWAVRKREEIQSGRGDDVQKVDNGSKRSWWDYRTSAKAPFELEVGMPKLSPVAAQLADMKTQYGDRLSVHIVVDEENTFFDHSHIQKALTSLSDNATTTPPTSSHAPGSCSLHDQKMHEAASEFEGGSSKCRCPPTEGVLPGKNLFVVSGPEGFVSHYAGPKTWAGGVQAQGPVGGVVAAIQKADPRLAREWLVLKL
jgi:ferredoxin-NADP reductase